MESDDKVSGLGNSYTTEFRQYDPRLGRWKSLDPLMAKYAMASPYSAFNNNPIYYRDPLGLEGEPPGCSNIQGGGCANDEPLDGLGDKPKVATRKKWYQRLGNWLIGNSHKNWKNKLAVKYGVTEDDVHLDPSNKAAVVVTEEDGKLKANFHTRESSVSISKTVDNGDGTATGYFNIADKSFDVSTSDLIYNSDGSSTDEWNWENYTVRDNMNVTVAPDIGMKNPTGLFKKLGKTKGAFRTTNSLKKTLPSWKKIKIDTKHIVSGHSKGGSRVAKGSKKDLFPDYMSNKSIENAIKGAYKNVFKKMKTQGDRVLLRGRTKDGMVIEMWLNKATRTIETAYPKL